ncbi:MAG: glycerol-3-phosphate 1-O-acyltransferase PlsY [Robiginitomaculum sp.]|nr:glycerol-3-phosphate 1-O-acyltransferase PlsY [Robiginitomaculum sp.]
MMGTENLYALLLGYLLGSIPFGLLIARFAGHGDIRNIGSGNIGATNVLRTGSKKLAIFTLLLDMGKAAAAALLAAHFFGFVPSLIAGGAALFGHCYPVWLKFKGGKGVATYFGVLLAVFWQIGLVAAAIWIASALLTRIVSLSGIITSVTVPIAAYFIGGPKIAALCAVLGAIIILRHRENIGRILAKTEPKIGAKK